MKRDKVDTAIWNYKDYGPSFGGGNGASDIYICYDFGTKGNRSNLGNSYELPKNLTYEHSETRSYLAGKSSFNVSNIEVY